MYGFAHRESRDENFHVIKPKPGTKLFFDSAKCQRFSGHQIEYFIYDVTFDTKSKTFTNTNIPTSEFSKLKVFSLKIQPRIKCPLPPISEDFKSDFVMGSISKQLDSGNFVLGSIGEQLNAGVAENTLVRLWHDQSKTTTIENIHIGDVIVGYNFSSNSWEPQVVVTKRQASRENLCDLWFDKTDLRVVDTVKILTVGGAGGFGWDEFGICSRLSVRGPTNHCVYYENHENHENHENQENKQTNALANTKLINRLTTYGPLENMISIETLPNNNFVGNDLVLSIK